MPGLTGLAMGRCFDLNVVTRFLASVEVDANGCWQWKGRKDKRGYGDFYFRGRGHRAHRVSHMMFKADIPDGLIVCHTCDDPGCVNPRHLFIGTPLDNVIDCIHKGRHRNVRNNKTPAHAKLSRDDVEDILTSNLIAVELQNKYGVSYLAIKHIRRSGSWEALQARWGAGSTVGGGW